VTIETGARSYRLVIAADDLDSGWFAAHVARAAEEPDPVARLAELSSGSEFRPSPSASAIRFRWVRLRTCTAVASARSKAEDWPSCGVRR
jgi:hypothetical protein